MSEIKILNILAQKPFATGSGVYLSELIKGFDKLGHRQGVIFAGDEKDSFQLDSLVEGSYKVKFNNETLPFPVFGMSDNMPYESSKYKDMNQEQKRLFRKAFEEIILKADIEFQPDLVICHHLYYVTAITAYILSHRKLIAICHGTCIRQMEDHVFERDFIRSNIAKLHRVYGLQSSQVEEIGRVYKLPKDKISEIGVGYNSEVFYEAKDNKDRKNKLVYAGKLSPSKGIEYLIRALAKLENPVELFIAGDGNDRSFVKNLKQIAECVEIHTSHKVYFCGRLGQKQLGDLFRQCEIFVLPSFYEGLPLVVTEAIACGLKVVYSKIEGSYKWFDDKFPTLSLIGIDMVGSVADDIKGDLNEKEYVLHISKAIEKSLKEEYTCQGEALKKLSWSFICDKIITELK